MIIPQQDRPAVHETPPLDLNDLRRACSMFPTGVVIATVIGRDGSPHGITVSSFTSVSLEPPLILICVDHRSRVVRHFMEDGYFAVNILNERQRHLSSHFAQKNPDRFSSVGWYPGYTGSPLLPEVLATMECKLRQRVPAGDHAILIGQVLRVTEGEGSPLAYFKSSYHTLVRHEQASTTK